MRENPDHIRHILEALATESAQTQRALAGRLGIALGSTNHLLRQLIARECIRGVRGPGSSVRYIVTPQGQEALAGMTRESLSRALVSYRTVLTRVRRALAACQSRPRQGAAGGTASIVVYGTGEVAQIAFVCAADLGVDLIGFVDDEPRPSFLGLPVRAPSEVRSMVLGDRAFDWLLVASFGADAAITRRLAALQFPLERVSWL
jgi:DNA-binding MarR family transcriptional regulator